ncbi:LysR family transcriptional regulator [Sorangium cellulosum]|uniref:LysR family transcriptional regulator n=1 Tax=Sorangium cellulosum TaxID=56 RepID=A0A2L0F395_SORCE|nr:LysR family transcriptional regulator [Sorangium cellulosum]AUX46003.1 LysR family transcriptional regulator [Sorangium cellulosum]
MNLSAIDVNLIVALDALLRERSVTRAARSVGLSQPAMSHALMRLREIFSDPLLLRIGRQMALTTRAEALIPQVATVMQELSVLFFGVPPPPFDPATSARTFRIATTEYVDLLLAPKLTATLSESSPKIALHLLPLDERSVDAVRSGDIDLAIGVFPDDDFPADVRRADLVEDRFVGLARASHPKARGRVDLETYSSFGHVLVPGRGAQDGIGDALVAKRDIPRRVAMTAPHVFLLPHLVVGSDLVATVGARIGRAFSSLLPIREFELPFELPPIEISMLWSNRTHDEPARAWLRGVVVDAVSQMQDLGRRRRA